MALYSPGGLNLADTTAPLILAYDDSGTKDVVFAVSSSGDLTITPDGGDVTVSGTFAVTVNIDLTTNNQFLRGVTTGAATSALIGMNASDQVQISAGVIPTKIAADLYIQATKKFYLDGGGDTYIVESAANTFQLVVGGVANMMNVTAVGVGFGGAPLPGRRAMAIDLPAQTLSVNDDFFWFQVASANAITVTGAGTTVATARFLEPNIVLSGGTVVNSATVLIGSVATEATNNYALWVDVGNTRLDGDVHLAATKKFYFDGGGDTYITENSANVLRCVAGGSGGVDLLSGGTSWTAVSDERLKTIIEPIEGALEGVGRLRSVIGRYKTDDISRRRSFLIAQDVQKVLPEAVTEGEDGVLNLSYTDVIPLLVAAINELEAKVA